MLNKLIFKDAWEVRDQIDNAQRKKIASLYKDWADELEAKAKKFDAKSTFSAPMSAMNARELKNLLIAQSNAISQEVDQLIRRDMYVVADAVVKNNIKWLEGLGFGGTHLEGAFANVPTTVVENLVSGKVYQGGWSLSQRIWGDNEDTLSKLYEIVGAGRAQNLSTYEITKQLEQYVRPGAKKQWNLKTKDGKRIYPKKVDYNAQRLARTLSQHAYQQSFIATIAKNPMIPKVIWWANGSRVCKICLSLHGQKFDKDKVPLDHPNGMCVLIPDVEANIEQQIADWVNAPDGTFPGMDEFAKSFGYVPPTNGQSVVGHLDQNTFKRLLQGTEREKEQVLAEFRKYTGFEYTEIRQDPVRSDFINEIIEKNKALQWNNGNLYRGVGMTDSELQALKVGKIIKPGTADGFYTNAPSSWSSREGVAISYSRSTLDDKDNRVVFVDKTVGTRNAISREGVTGPTPEAEAIYSGNTEFEIVSIDFEHEYIYENGVKRKVVLVIVRQIL